MTGLWTWTSASPCGGGIITPVCGETWLSILVLHQAKTPRSQRTMRGSQAGAVVAPHRLTWGNPTGGLPHASLLTQPIPYSHLISLIKLGTISHALNIEMLRHALQHARPRVPQASQVSRTCPWCHTPGALHDELHYVLECPSISETAACGTQPPLEQGRGHKTCGRPVV